ncbi:MAG: NAD(P)-dependent glycerol-3-phosphate dehydrogenase [Myxococcales bacterium]|nr:NAD(P)-dependent glycerol-3-phosphate dehydrogenase [Myxococcales bacterium]
MRAVDSRAVSLPIAVIGGGSFGTCLAMLCAREDDAFFGDGANAPRAPADVVVWARDADVVDAMNRTRRNPRYLRDAVLPPSVRATTDLGDALRHRELVILAVPSHALRDVMRAASPHLADGAVLVSTVKGIEGESGLTMHGVLEDVLDPVHHPRIVSLSGPSFASEIARRKPTVVTLACREETYAISVQATLSCPWFRCYTNTDVTGVELGGALKNVIAIATGIADGMEGGHNARAALMTRGLAEITKLGLHMGAEPTTFLGLSGMGDLILTCTGDLSRNRRVGLALGRGRALAEVLEEMGEVAEGVSTTRAACRLAARAGIEMPICETVRAVLDGEMTPLEAGRSLMTRQLRSERDDFAR